MQFFSHHNHHGFSLLEVLLTIGLFSILAVLIVPAFRSLILENDLTVSSFLVVEAARTAETNAVSGVNDTPWGVQVASSSVTIFSGASYGARDMSQDTVYILPPSITVATPQQVVFAPFTGLPGSSAAMQLTSLNNHQRQVTVNPLGIVSY